MAAASGTLGLGSAHRALSAFAIPPLAAVVVSSRLTHRRLFAPALAALALFGVAALVTVHPLHVAFAAASLAAASISAAQAFRGAPAQRSSWRDYVTLTKPRIMVLLLLTGFCGMCVAARGLPAAGLAAATMTGLALACGGASALNHVLDADIDRFMRRTDKRPVAAQRVPPSRALEFGLALSAFSFVLLASAVNLLTAVLALVGNLFYVLVYTRWLKRSTPQNIVIGGAAGAVPPLVGWAAVTGNLTLPALFLFLIVFLWTPPHFWALALLIRREYEAARIPMLPVVRGERETARQIVLYSLVLVAATILPFAWGTLGVAYLAASLLLGALFLRLAVRLRRETSPARASALFHFSLLYLALLFVAMAVDTLL
ncbi:MAG: heme o synthase [Gaiellaceae bacterium]